MFHANAVNEILNNSKIDVLWNSSVVDMLGEPNSGGLTSILVHNNKTNKKISMTTPVTRIEKNGNMTMQFYLPSKYNQDNAPDPSSNEVKIVNIEGGYYAVIKYSGRASNKNFIKHKEILENELKKDNISIAGPAIKASYNSPFTLPMLKRNEAMFKVSWK